MAEPKESNGKATAGPSGQTVNHAVKKNTPKSKLSLQQIYALPAPIRTFPLPNFYPGNPLSIIHIALAWLRQTLFRPVDEPATKYSGTWSPETRSVHITDETAMRALWEHGFFGKGSLSRSEPNWLKREQIRRGLVAGNVQEQLTTKRREERMWSKWERARLEQEAIERTRLEESRASLKASLHGNGEVPKTCLNGDTHREPTHRQQLVVLPPVGPLELLRLPNSPAELRSALGLNGVPHSNERVPEKAEAEATASSTNGTKLNGVLRRNPPIEPVDRAHGSVIGTETSSWQAHVSAVNGYAMPPVDSEGVISNGGVSEHLARRDGEDAPVMPNALKRRKSVRFSAEVESTTFEHNDPPSPGCNIAVPLGDTNESPTIEPEGTKLVVEAVPDLSPVREDQAQAQQSGRSAQSLQPFASINIENKEHLRLSREEAFYLAFAIGALSVVDPRTKAELSTLELVQLFADHSFFPPRVSDSLSDPIGGLRTDDPFLVHYVVYHHFRSLGWVPREGVKFGVDFLLYRRGPVFDHAEFGIAVLPSYTDPRWRGHERHVAPQRSWHWLLGLQRVLSHVIKSLVLVYVDIPPPSALEQVSGTASTPGGGVVGLLERYKLREVMVRRWSSNRNR